VKVSDGNMEKHITVILQTIATEGKLLLSPV
jgi:hypothetical protein